MASPPIDLGVAEPFTPLQTGNISNPCLLNGVGKVFKLQDNTWTPVEPPWYNYNFLMKVISLSSIISTMLQCFASDYVRSALLSAKSWNFSAPFLGLSAEFELN